MKFDFKAIRKIAKENGLTYIINNRGGLKFNMQKNGQTWLISHNQKNIFEAHNNAALELRKSLISMAIITETDFII